MTMHPSRGAIVLSTVLLSACPSDDGPTEDTDMGTSTGGQETGPAPQCVTVDDCGECQLCQDGMCVEDPECEEAECEVDEDCGDCMLCTEGACEPDPACEDTGDVACEGDVWCEDGETFCVDGTCTDVPAPTTADACDLDDPKAVEVEPQIQNVAVAWLDVDGDGSQDVVAAAANSLNVWLAPDWTLSKTALTHEGSGMALLAGAEGRAVEIGTAASVVALHRIEDTGSFTSLGEATLSSAPLQVVAFDGEASGADHAAVRNDAAIVQIAIDGDTLTEGDVLYDAATTDVATLRQGGGDQLVAALDTGRAVLIGLDGGAPVVDEDGAINPWGGERAVAFGGKHGVVGGGAIALSTLDVLETLTAPEGALSVGAFEGASLVAVGGPSDLVIYDLSGETPCEVTVAGGPFEAVALGDLGGGTLGIATVVSGELMLFTLSDVLDQ